MTDNPPERRAVVLLAFAGATVAVLVLVVLIWFLPWWLVVLLALAAAALVAWFVHRSADDIVLKKVGAQPLSKEEAPRLHNMVEGLCVWNGFAQPDLYVIDDNALNALVVGGSGETSAIAVTRGLTETLTTIELEGVVAHLLSKVARGDTVLATRVAVVVGLPLAPFGSVARTIGAKFLGTQRSVLADMEGVKMTRYPPGLGKALDKMARDGRQLKDDPLGIRHLWIAMPAGSLVPAEFALQDRIALLHEL